MAKSHEEGGALIKLNSLGTRIVIFFVVLLVLVQGLGAFLVIQANSQIARQTIDSELEQGERVFKQLLVQNQARLEQGAGILSADFAFRQAIASNDTGTILSVLRNHGARVGASVMTLASLDNMIRADTLDPYAHRHMSSRIPDLIHLASVEGHASSIVILRGQALPAGGRIAPVLAPRTHRVGRALAFEVDDSMAKDLHQLTGLEVTFANRAGEGAWQLHASTLPLELRRSLQANLVGDDAIAANLVDVAGEQYETRVTPLEARPDRRVAAILQKPLQVGLAPFRAASARSRSSG